MPTPALLLEAAGSPSDEKFLMALCEGCPENSCEGCPVPKSMGRYRQRRRHERRVVVAIATGVFVVVSFFGLLAWQVWDTHQVVEQHTAELATTTALGRDLVRFENSATTNHTSTLGALDLLQQEVVALCKAVPGCKSEGNSP